MRTRAILTLSVALLASLATRADAQWAISQQTTPKGLPYVQLLLPGEKEEAIAVAWPDGTIVSAPDKVGLSGLGPLFVGSGTQELSASDLAETLKDLQGSGFIGTRSQFAVAGASAPEQNFAQVAALYGQALSAPRLDDRDLKRLRDRIYANAKQRQDEPQQVAGRAFRRMLLGDTPWFRVMAGWPPDSVMAIQKSDVADWRRNVFVRDGMVVAAAGPTATDALGPQIDAMLANLPQSGALPNVTPPLLLNPGRLVVLERAVGQSIIITGAPAGRLRLQDAMARDLGVAALNGLTGRLGATVRGALGATYNINASLIPVTQGESLFAISTAVSNDKVLEALGAVRTEYARFLTDGITAEELDQRRSASKTAFVEAMRRPQGAAAMVRENLLRHRPLDYPNQREAMLDSVTTEKVAAVLKSSLPSPPLTTIVVTPSAEGLGADCVIQAEADLSRCLQ